MEYFRIGLDKQKISRICMGGSSPKTDLFTEAAATKAFEEALETAYSIGINFFDSAEAYGGGKSEEILGKVLAPIREKVFLSSKASWEHSSAKDLRRACENSLRSMNTSYIDLYYLHYPNREIPIGESITTLLELKEEGKIGAIGLSNFSLPQIMRAAEYGKIDVLQQCYSLLWRSYPEKYLFPYCREHGIKIKTLFCTVLVNC
jgi:aryl-alcohol dehydrogenase-like predicted oxidoreductase